MITLIDSSSRIAGVQVAVSPTPAPHIVRPLLESTQALLVIEQLTFASRAWQYGHRGASGSTAAPQFGQCKDAASTMVTH